MYKYTHVKAEILNLHMNVWLAYVAPCRYTYVRACARIAHALMRHALTELIFGRPNKALSGPLKHIGRLLE